MKPVEDVTAVVADYGTFISVADKLGETYKKVYYYAPVESEYQDIREVCQAVGLDNVERIDDVLESDILDETDLFIFPDIAFTGLQRHLRDMGKAVWGHLGGCDLELYRTYFLEVLESVGLPVIPYEKIKGLTNLALYLKDHKDVWVKIDRFRGNMETWHHKDYDSSKSTLDSLAYIFGGMKEHVMFIVQENVPTEIECGYDGWCIDGFYPPASFQGYEDKNQLYLGSVISDKDLPEEIKIVNEKMAPCLQSYGYRGWWATEIRVGEDGTIYFIDPTPRHPGQTGEHQLETITNLAEIIWKGANGIIVEPEFEWEFAAEATLHYEMPAKDGAADKEWKGVVFPESVLRWLKLYHYCQVDGMYWFPNADTDELGVAIGVGDSADEAIKHVTKILEELHELPIHAEIGGFAKLLAAIKTAEEQGITFGGKIPSPESIIRRSAKLL